MEYIRINEGKLHIVFGITEDRLLKLLHISAAEFDESNFRCDEQQMREMFQPVQVNFAGYDRPYEKHGNKCVSTAPGYLLKYVGMEDTRNEIGRCLTFEQQDDVIGAHVKSIWQFYEGTDVIRMRNTVTNISNEVQTLDYISSFTYAGIEKEKSTESIKAGIEKEKNTELTKSQDNEIKEFPSNEEDYKSTDTKMEVRIPYNGWQKEMNWQTFSFPQLGLGQTQPTVTQRTSEIFEVTNTGNWSTKKYLPIGYIGNKDADTALFWQIEHNGSWHWEISDMHEHFYVSVSGPTEVHSHWFVDLKPGESFTSVPVAVGVSHNDINDAFGELTKYRRLIRRKNKDNEKLPVIFNDYMNCLFGDPTTEKEIPLIDAAAEAGCEYFCVDAGWYSSGLWWDLVGEWEESRERFPGGIREVMDYIRSKGMIPGVWLEPEVMGINCDLAKKVPDDWFFVRHGKRVYDRSRYQLDYRNPEVIKHITGVVDRLVNEYGVGYIKVDYNIEPGIGTELYADSVGEGLRQHEQAYLNWIDTILKKYPDLVLENCGSGGLRIDYALLSRYSIQSVSDQEDYINFATIAANAASGLTPEQAAIWSYPQREGTPEKEHSLRSKAELSEETIYNMVNAMLLRIHQSGHLAELNPERLALVKEGIAYYKSIRNNIKDALPYWGTGLADSRDTLLSSGLICGNTLYLAVWRRGGEEQELVIPLGDAITRMQNVTRETEGGTEAYNERIASGTEKRDLQVSCTYPAKRPVSCYIDKEERLHVNLDKEVMARILEIKLTSAV